VKYEMAQMTWHKLHFSILSVNSFRKIQWYMAEQVDYHIYNCN